MVVMLSGGGWERKMTLEGSLRIERVAFGAWAFAV
jgi:hypothetical protein